MEYIELKFQTNLNNNLLNNFMALLFFKDLNFKKTDVLKVYCYYNKTYLFIDDYSIEKLYRNVDYKYISIFSNIITGYNDKESYKLLKGWNYSMDVLPETKCNLLIIKRINPISHIGLSLLAQLKK